MNNQESGQKGLLESGLIASIGALFAIAAVYIPTLFPLLFLLPVPFIILISRQGLRYGVLSLIGASLVIGLLTGMLSTVIILILFVPPALVMGVLIRKRYRDFTIIGAGTALSIFTIFASIQLLSSLGGVQLLDEIAVLLKGALETQKDVLLSMDLQIGSVEDLVNSFMTLFPALIIVQAMLGAFINYFVSLSILKKVGTEGITLSELSYFKLPGNIVFGSFLIFALTYFTSYFKWFNAGGLMANVMLIFTFVFFTQGLAYLSFMMKRMNFKKTIRIVLLALIFVITPLLTVIAMLGLIDAVFDMRRLRVKG